MMRVLLAGLLIVSAAGVSAFAAEPPTRNVLLLHSYHSGYEWTDSITTGVRAVFDNQPRPIELWVEYLDTQRDSSTNGAQRLRQLLADKYAHHPIALVLAMDDAAVELVLDQHDALFPGVPVVFGGLNNHALVARMPRNTWAGVLEEFAPARMLDAGLALFPAAHHVIVVTEDTVTAQYLRQVYETVAKNRSSLAFTFLDGHERSLDDIVRELTAAPPDSLVLTSAFHLDQTGTYFPRDEALRRIVTAARAPVLSPSVSDVSPGLLLGSENGGIVHGQKAATIALRVLAGEQPSTIPIAVDQAEHVLANAAELDRWHIPEARLPAPVMVVNRQPSFLREHGRLAAATAAFIGLQMVAIGLLVANVRRRRRAERSLAGQARALAASNATLEEMNRALVSAQEDRNDAEERLRHAQRLDAVGRLAGGIAHDFNNVLTIIDGYCQIAQAATEPGDGVWPSLEEIRKASARASALTHQLLAFSRKQVLQPTLVDLNEVVADMQNMLQRLIGEHIRLVTELAPCLPPVLVDEGQWQQVVVNLAVNARDAMPDGGVLRLRTAIVEVEDSLPATPPLPAGRYVALEVHDTGQGMAPDVRARIFEPFFTTKERDKGIGLGLAMVYGIVQQSGGSIRVESTPGAGSTFSLYLAPSTAKSSARVPATTPRAAAARGETVLLVEDQDDVRALVTRILRGRGYTVMEAANGPDAIALAADADRIDLVVTDVVMPGMRGPEVAARLRAGRPGLPVLYISGYTDDVVDDSVDQVPRTELLQKPFTPDVLAARVRDVLERAHLR